jgi:asparagine synthetase B (glutamine-hydrolysing)
MRDKINRYLTYGCSKEFPPIDTIKKTDMSFQDCKEALLSITNEVIESGIVDPQNTIFQCSGGFDSSVIISKFKGIKTFCTCDESMSDYKYSSMASEHFGTRHQFISEDDITEGANIERCLLDMNKIHSNPRGYINDLGLYLFVKRIKEQTDIITGGEGIELMYLGYSNMFMNPIHASVWFKDYDMEKANGYAMERKILGSPLSIDPLKLLKVRKHKGFESQNYFNLMEWWSTGFSAEDIRQLGFDAIQPPNPRLFDYVNYVFRWYGEEFYFDRRLEYANHFGLKWVSPFLDKRFIDFSLSLPIEMRNCCGQIKYIMYESLGHMLPRFIIDRPKEGLVLSFKFYLKRRDEIYDLMSKYLDRPESMIYEYLNRDMVERVLSRFRVQFDFNHLRKVWMLINLEMWLTLRKCDGIQIGGN